MNFFQILSEIEKVDPEVYDRLDSRRRVFKHLSGLGGRLAASAVPLALGAVLNKAYAQTSAAPSVIEVFRFALKLEYLEYYFYNAGLGARTIVGQPTPPAFTTAQTALRNKFSANNLTALTNIQLDEANHVIFLTGVLSQLQPGVTFAAPPITQFDFTGGGSFTNVFTSEVTFLAVAQSLEDTGVRAYKGAAPYLMADKTLLTLPVLNSTPAPPQPILPINTNIAALEAALNIHSVEARHASRLRTMRRAGATNTNPAQTVVPNLDSEAARSGLTGTPKNWISGRDNGGASPPQTAAIYGAGNAITISSTTLAMPAEDNTIHGGTNVPIVATFPALSYSEAFDEPLDIASVAVIANKFTTSAYF